MEKTKVLLIQNTKRLRKKAGFTQEQLAEKSGISISFLKDIERGESLGTAATLDALARGLKVSIADLFAEEESNLVSFPVSGVLKKMASVPDSVYDLAEKYGPDHGIWRIVEGVLESHLDALEKEKRKGKAN